MYQLLFMLTTTVVLVSIAVAVAVTILQPQRQQRVEPPPQQSQLPSSYQGTQNRTTGLPTQLSPTQSAPAAQSETWVLKGFAVGKGAGNETGDTMMAEVVRLSDGKYRLYYGWAKPDQPTAIKSALSTDGKTWTVESGYRLQGSSDTTDREYVVSGPSLVRLPDGRWRMYYQSSPQIEQGKPPAFHVRSAISNDGLTFTREGVRIDISPYTTATGLSLAGHGAYVIASDGTYVGIFSANVASNTTPSDLVMATSKDGLAWSGFKRLYQKWHDPVVLKTNKGYIIYATYLTEKQGMAVSTDGLTWPGQMTDITMQDEQGNRLTESNSGVGDIGGVVLPDGSIRLYVNYGSQQKAESIAYLEKQ